MVWKKDLTPASKGGDVIKHIGKGSTQETLPFPGANASVVPGDPHNRVRQNYSKSASSPAPMNITVAILGVNRSHD